MIYKDMDKTGVQKSPQKKIKILEGENVCNKAIFVQFVKEAGNDNVQQ